MTDKTAAQIANMKKQTIGVEVKMKRYHLLEGGKSSTRFLQDWQIRVHRMAQQLCNVECVG